MYLVLIVWYVYVMFEKHKDFKQSKTEYMCFNQTGDISTLNSNILKRVDKFTYLESSVSSTETDIDT